MLQENFFSIRHLESTGHNIRAELMINAGHTIFEGHFPGRPVVPGVCMLQMVKEILEHVMARKYNLVKAQEIKFLAIIDPKQNNIISAAIQYSGEENGSLTVTATLFKDALTHLKFKGLFDFQQPH